MPIDYENVKRAWRRNKSACTKAQNRKDWDKVIEVCERAFEDFDRYGWPDNWAHFERAMHDAHLSLAEGRRSAMLWRQDARP